MGVGEGVGGCREGNGDGEGREGGTIRYATLSPPE